MWINIIAFFEFSLLYLMLGAAFGMIVEMVYEDAFKEEPSPRFLAICALLLPITFTILAIIAIFFCMKVLFYALVLNKNIL